MTFVKNSCIKESGIKKSLNKEMPTPIACSSNSLMFDGIFQGREGEIRITADKKWISVFDVISVVGGQENPYSSWERIKNVFPEVLATSNSPVVVKEIHLSSMLKDS